MLKVGYIGLGLMGKSIARNILKQVFPSLSITARAARWMNSWRRGRCQPVRRRWLPHRWT